MGIALPTMKGRILTVLALLVASCQMKSTKHFLVETKTQTKDDEPARKGEDYFFSGSGGMGNIKIGGSHGDQGFGVFPNLEVVDFLVLVEWETQKLVVAMVIKDLGVFPDLEVVDFLGLVEWET